MNKKTKHLQTNQLIQHLLKNESNYCTWSQFNSYKEVVFPKRYRDIDQSQVLVHFHYLANKREGNIYDSNICYNIIASE